MKNTFKYLILTLVAVFASCNSSDDVTANSDNNGNENPTPIPINASYWPYVLGNKWNYINVDDSEDTLVTDLYRTIIYEGKTYFQFKPLNASEDFELTDGTREDNGVFYELHGASSQMGVNVAAGTIKSIDTNANVGEEWTDILSLTVSGAASGTIQHINKGKIIEKVASITINGQNYQDVLKTELIKIINNSITGYNIIIKNEDWLAKGIGPIYRKTTNYYGINEEVRLYHLTSYTLN